MVIIEPAGMGGNYLDLISGAPFRSPQGPFAARLEWAWRKGGTEKDEEWRKSDLVRPLAAGPLCRRATSRPGLKVLGASKSP